VRKTIAELQALGLSSDEIVVDMIEREHKKTAKGGDTTRGGVPAVDTAPLAGKTVAELQALGVSPEEIHVELARREQFQQERSLGGVSAVDTAPLAGKTVVELQALCVSSNEIVAELQRREKFQQENRPTTADKLAQESAEILSNVDTASVAHSLLREAQIISAGIQKLKSGRLKSQSLRDKVHASTKKLKAIYMAVMTRGEGRKTGKQIYPT
jgi:phosphoribosyl-ATP pyrophosphohydrolase